MGLAEVIMFMEIYFLQHKERTLKQCFNLFDENRSGDIGTVELQLLQHRGYLCFC